MIDGDGSQRESGLLAIDQLVPAQLSPDQLALNQLVLDQLPPDLYAPPADAVFSTLTYDDPSYIDEDLMDPHVGDVLPIDEMVLDDVLGLIDPALIDPALRDQSLRDQSLRDRALRDRGAGSVRAVDELDRIADDLVQIERGLANLNARRVGLLAQANAWAGSMVDAIIPIGATEPHRREMAHRSVVAEISCALRVPQQTVGADIAQSTALAAMEATMASLKAGRISYRHAQVLADTCESVPAEGRGTLEAELLPIAETSTVAGLKRKARASRERMHPQPIVERTRDAVAMRRIVLEAADDGMGWIHHYLPIASAIGIYETTTQIAHSRRGGDESRTMDQLRSDALLELIDEGVDIFVNGPRTDESPESDTDRGSVTDRDSDTDRGSATASNGTRDVKKSGRNNRNKRGPHVGVLRPSVFLTVPVLTAMGRNDEPAELEGYGPVDPVTAREITADAPSFYRVLTDPIAGTILDIDRKRYKPPADMRRYLRMRDKTCRFPFCGKRAGHSDIDHTLAWEHDGKTRVQNLAHLCGGDHTLKHGSSWQVTQDVGGVLHWTSPTGRCYTTVPETPIGRRALNDALAAGAAGVAGAPNDDGAPQESGAVEPGQNDSPPF
jgi:hypothetical protein